MKINKNYKIIVIVLLVISSLTFGFAKRFFVNLHHNNSAEKIMFQTVKREKVALKNVLSQNQEILGIWFMENEPNNKVEFLQDGHVKTYIDDVLAMDNTYSITNNCNGLSTGDERIYLKIIDGEDDSIDYNIINGINEDNSGILSLITNNGKTLIYIR